MYHSTAENADVNGEFVDEDLTATPPVEATSFNAYWCNMVQRELLNVLAGAGITPDEHAFNQVWKSIESVGLKSIVSESSTVSVSGFSGTTVVLHSASNFAFSGTLNFGSVVVIIPMWQDNSPDYIQVTYNSLPGAILKYNIFVGVVISALGPSLQGVQIPIKKTDGSMALTSLVAGSLKYNEMIDNNVVSFTYDAEDDDSWQEWQLSSNWKNGQVKRVYATNDYEVSIFCNGVGAVKFKKGCYKEFICIGSVTIDEIEYAKFIMNG